MKEHLPLTGKLDGEFTTIKAMTAIYCKAHHIRFNGEIHCSSCRDFLAYANEKLDRCPYGTMKPTCNKCPIHCYKKDIREQARIIMRYAGPRMLLKHPILTIKHFKAAKIPVPETVPLKASNRHYRKLNQNDQ